MEVLYIPYDIKTLRIKDSLSPSDKESLISHFKGRIPRSHLRILESSFSFSYKSLSLSIKTHLFVPKVGYVSLKDSIFWGKVYDLYKEVSSLKKLYRDLGIHPKTLKKAFNFFGFELLSKNLTLDKSIERMRHTNILRYGGPSPRYSEDVNDKIKRTCESLYNGSSSFSSRDVQSKCKSSFAKKYGVSSFFGTREYKEGLLRTRFYKVKSDLESYGYKFLDNFIGDRVQENGCREYIRYKIKHLKCGTIFEDDVYAVPRCPKCFSSPFHSKLESLYSLFLESLGLVKGENFVENDQGSVLWKCKSSNYNRKVYHELDLFCSERRLAFEINGLYTHSYGHTPIFKDGRTLQKKDKLYHKNKTGDALHSGVDLIHIWEDDNPDIIKSKIRIKLSHFSVKRIYARKCAIIHVDSFIEREFLCDNHLHGYASSLNKFTYGLMYEDILVSVISFRRMRNGDVELARFASLLNTVVIGGFGKLLKRILPLLKSEGFSNLISYAYSDWTPDYRNSVYYKYGFSYEGWKQPSMYYWKYSSKKRESRQKYQKHKLKKLFPESFNPSLREIDILALNKIYPIYNSGNHKFCLTL